MQAFMIMMTKTRMMNLLGFTPLSELDSHVERIAKLEAQLLYADSILDSINSQLNERYEGEWKLSKDGTKRYRKVATKVLVNRWKTESQPLIEVIV